jgi:predicted ATPase/DNA-binding XRE family transcriptional regulator
MNSELSFGEQLRQHRVRAGLTQESLAERAGLTANAISALERGERRRPYPNTLRALAEALGLSAAERAALFALGAGRAPAQGVSSEHPSQHESGGAGKPPLAPDTLPVTNLPAPISSFVGRASELAELTRLLQTQRLVTLTGAGGSGKTRLALAAASAVASDIPDGVWLVELANLSDPNFVPETVGHALGLSEEAGKSCVATISGFLRSRAALLVLDNCEHLVDACAQLAERLLSACPRLRICATSRELLRVPGELTYLVPTLPVPAPDGAASPAEIARYDAVRLFVDRAATQQPGFQLTAANAEPVVAICRRLDGIPLAIELAAARVRTMPPAQLVERLDNSIRFLTGGSRTVTPRQQTLRGTLDWSYNLLDMAQQRLLRRLSVFIGGWDLETAEVVGATYDAQSEPVAEVLSRLAEQSLVVAEVGGASGRARYRMLEPVRQYALQLLEESGEAQYIRQRHAALYLALAEQIAPELRRAAKAPQLNQLGEEHDNLRAALAWALRNGDLEVAASLCWAIWPFWWIRGYHREGRRWLEQVRAQGALLPARVRSRLLMASMAIVYVQGDVAATQELADRLVVISQELGGDPHAEAYAHAGYGLLAMSRGELDLAITQLELSLPLLERAGEAGMAAQNHTWLGTALLLKGEREEATRRFEQGLAAGQRIGGPVAILIALFNLAQLALAAGDYALAARRLTEGLPICVAMGDQGNLIYFLEGLAVVAAATGDHQRGAQLFAAAERLLERIGQRGHTYYQLDQSLHQRTQAELQTHLGAAAFAAARAAGRAMPFEQVMAEALDVPRRLPS